MPNLAVWELAFLGVGLERLVAALRALARVNCGAGPHSSIEMQPKRAPGGPLPRKGGFFRRGEEVPCDSWKERISPNVGAGIEGAGRREGVIRLGNEIAELSSQEKRQVIIGAD